MIRGLREHLLHTVTFLVPYVITDGLLPGVRGLQGHLLHTVTFLCVSQCMIYCPFGIDLNPQISHN